MKETLDSARIESDEEFRLRQGWQAHIPLFEGVSEDAGRVLSGGEISRESGGTARNLIDAHLSRSPEFGTPEAQLNEAMMQARRASDADGFVARILRREGRGVTL